MKMIIIKNLRCKILLFKFNYIKDSYSSHHFIKKYYILFWQKYFEEFILMKNFNQFYTSHFSVKKINRWGLSQDRILLITNQVNLKKILIFLVVSL